MDKSRDRRPHRVQSNSQSARFVEDRMRLAAQRLAAERYNRAASLDATATTIDLLIGAYPDCPRWASQAVDQLLLQEEFLYENSA